MKNSLRMIGISIILWLGLGIGLANAATSILTSNSSGTDVTLEKNTPESMIGMDGTSGASGSDLAALDVSFAAVGLPDSVNTVLASATTSSSLPSVNVTELSSANSTSLHAGTINEFAANASFDSKYENTPCC